MRTGNAGMTGRILPALRPVLPPAPEKEPLY